MRKLFEVYFMDDEPLTGGLQQELDGLIADVTPRADTVIVTDFGHGLIGPSSIDLLASSSRFLAVNTQANSANMGYNLISKYPRADYVCIDAPEARLAVADRVSKLSDIAHRIVETEIDCPNIIITHGKYGCVTCERHNGVHTIPAICQ